MKRCVQCQNELPDTAMHCVYCGARQPAAPAPAAGPGARTVMGYPGMASDAARQAGAAGKPRGNQVSGFEATQPLANDRFRDPRDPRGMLNLGAAEPGAGFDPAPRASSPAPHGFGPDHPQGGMGGPGQPPRYGSEPAPPPRYGSEPQRYGSERAPYGGEAAPFGAEPPPRYGSEPQHGFGQPPGGPGFGPGPAAPHHLGQHPFGPPSDPAFAQGPGPRGPGPQGGFGPPDGGFGYGGPGSGPVGRAGSQPIPQHGFGPPPGPPQHGFGPPPDGFGGPQHGFGPPPAGSGFSPVHGPGPHGAPHYGPPPGGFHPRPETELVAPLRAPYMPPHPRRASVHGEPWSEPLKTLMLVFGVLLVACFVAPWSVLPGKTTFSWSLLAAELPVSIKIMPLLFIITGVLSVVLGALPLATLVRGFAAAGIGLVPILYGSVAPAFDWRELIGLVGAVTLISGLLVRSHYTGEMIGRLLATVGAVCVLLQVLIPVGGVVPLVEMFKAVAHGQGAAILSLVPVVLAILAFLVWMPPPGRAGAHILAWVMIVWPLVAAIGFWLMGENLGDTLKVNLSGILYAPLAQMAWTALTGYGVATVVGKQLDHV